MPDAQPKPPSGLIGSVQRAKRRRQLETLIRHGGEELSRLHS